VGCAPPRASKNYGGSNYYWRGGLVSTPPSVMHSKNPVCSNTLGTIPRQPTPNFPKIPSRNTIDVLSRPTDSYVQTKNPFGHANLQNLPEIPIRNTMDILSRPTESYVQTKKNHSLTRNESPAPQPTPKTNTPTYHRTAGRPAGHNMHLQRSPYCKQSISSYKT